MLYVQGATLTVPKYMCVRVYGAVGGCADEIELLHVGSTAYGHWIVLFGVVNYRIRRSQETSKRPRNDRGVWETADLNLSLTARKQTS